MPTRTFWDGFSCAHGRGHVVSVLTITLNITAFWGRVMALSLSVVYDVSGFVE